MLWLLMALVGLGLWLVHDGLLPARTRPARTAPRAWSGLHDWLVQTGVPISPRLFLALCLAGALLGGLLADVLLGGPIPGAVGLLLGGAVYPLVLRGRHARRRRAVLLALPEAIDRLRDSLASTIPMDVALARLGTTAGPEPLRPQLPPAGQRAGPRRELRRGGPALGRRPGRPDR